MIDGLILAFEFFSRLPLRKNVDFTEKNISFCIFFMPFVGLCIGFFAAIVFSLISRLDLLIASFLTVTSILILTGGLHLDGLADTFDGFFSNREKDKTLEIMKDSRIGTFGTIAIILVLLGKIILIYKIRDITLIAIILSLGNARLATSINISHRNSAKNEGLGFLFYKSKPLKKVIISTILYIILVLIVNPFNILPLIGTIIFGLAFARWSDRKIGGLTGDVNGATIELGEIISLLVFWGVAQWI
jgi:adenosylcobinamide-GDP ribazoletransferase